MVNSIFIDESKRGEWFVVAGVFLRDVALGEGDRCFLRGLHATDDRRRGGDRSYKSNLRRVLELLGPRGPRLVYSVRSLERPVKVAVSAPLRFAGIKTVLTPFIPFFGVGSWQVVVEQFGEFQDRVNREGQKDANRVRLARTRAVKQYLLGEVTYQMESLYGLEREVSLKLSFTSQTGGGPREEAWLGATDYLAYAISEHWSRNDSETAQLKETLGGLSLYRADA